MKKASALIILGTLLAISCHAAGEKKATTKDDCASDAGEYMRLFNACKPVKCVSPTLYGVIAVQSREGRKPTKPPKRIYPAGYRWAWVAGYENLPLYAEWQNENCDEGVVTKSILTYVGFGPDDISPDDDYYLSVMDLGEEPSLFVPSFERWFLAFTQEYDLRIPLPAQKKVVLANDPQADPDDPISKFVYLTGCDAEAAAKCVDSTGSPGEGCGRPYAETAKALAPVAPGSGGSTKRCVETFKEHVGSVMRAPEVRALLVYCVDANPCNTGVGLSFNPAYPPGQEADPAKTHYTGREFALDNKTLKAVGAVTTKLPEVTQ